MGILAFDEDTIRAVKNVQDKFRQKDPRAKVVFRKRVSRKSTCYICHRPWELPTRYFYLLWDTGEGFGYGCCNSFSICTECWDWLGVPA